MGVLGLKRLSLRELAALVVWVVATLGAVAWLANSQHESRELIKERLAQRAVVASQFVSTYVGDVVERERRMAQAHLSGARVSEAEFERVVTDEGFGAAVLLDENGRLLRVHPHRPALIGTDIGSRYDHLTGALDGEVTVSDVVPSAAEGAPIVAFAVPFDTPSGRRVYSGAQDIGATAAGDYLRSSVSLPRTRLFLLDAKGTVIASKGGATASAPPESIARGRTADVELGGEKWRLAVSPIGGTSWRAVIAVPHSVLFASVSGAATWLAWVLMAGYILVSLLAMALLRRVSQSRRHLAALNSHLEFTMRIDPLTGVTNRRGLEEQLARAVSSAHRHRHPLSLLILDVDRFKSVNDEHGHAAGDRVLEQLAAVINRVLRTEDVVGRWGGEEFLAILPETGPTDALALAERLRATVESTRVVLPGGRRLGITVSIGVDTSIDADIGDRLARADSALYAAKDAGRNRVLSARTGSRDPRLDDVDLATGV